MEIEDVSCCQDGRGGEEGCCQFACCVGFSCETLRCMFQNYNDSFDEASENLLELLVKNFLEFVVGN